MLQRLNQTLGRAVYRVIGTVIGLAGLAAVRAAWSGIETGELLGGIVLGTVGLACAALAWWCFRPERRLTDLEP